MPVESRKLVPIKDQSWILLQRHLQSAPALDFYRGRPIRVGSIGELKPLNPRMLVALIIALLLTHGFEFGVSTAFATEAPALSSRASSETDQTWEQLKCAASFSAFFWAERFAAGC